MAARNKATWIVVFDGAQARFFALRRHDDGQVFEEIMAPLAAGNEKPPRVRTRSAARPSVGTGSPMRYAADARADYQKSGAMRFAREIAKYLDAGVDDKRYDRLVLVGPPRNLAELRGFLAPRVRETLVHEVPKNFTNLGTDALWENLSRLLLKAARPMNGTDARSVASTGGDFPVSVVFRNMEPSPTVQAQALRYAAKMGRKFDRIVNCRITIDAAHHAHRKVKLFGVSVDLKLPGRDVAGKSDSSNGSSADVNVALREAFGTATRQMQEHVGRMQAESVRNKRRASERRRLSV